jgi:hypothetical protein
MSLKPKLNQKDALARARKLAGPAPRADGYLLVGIIPDFETTPEWREAQAGPHYETWRHSAYDVERIQAAIALAIIRKLRSEAARKGIHEGDPFWTTLAMNVLRSQHHWHQSGRIRLATMRALRGRWADPTVNDTERARLTAVLQQSLIRAIDEGAGEEFKPLTKIAKAIGGSALRKALDERVQNAPTRPIRLNSQRMLDVMSGKPYGRYRG